MMNTRPDPILVFHDVNHLGAPQEKSKPSCRQRQVAAVAMTSFDDKENVPPPAALVTSKAAGSVPGAALRSRAKTTSSSSSSCSSFPSSMLLSASASSSNKAAAATAASVRSPLADISIQRRTTKGIRNPSKTSKSKKTGSKSQHNAAPTVATFCR